MDEPSTQNKDLVIASEIDDIFSSFDIEYDKLKERITVEISDYKNSLQGEKKRAEILKKKVPARIVMEAMLPLLSDIKNDVITATNLDELKNAIEIRFCQLNLALERVGVKLKEYKGNEYISNEEKINGLPIITDNPNQDHRVAKTNSMGCVIRGEEDNPILADVDIFVYKSPEIKEDSRQVQDRQFQEVTDDHSKQGLSHHSFENERIDQLQRKRMESNAYDAIQLVRGKKKLVLQKDFIIKLLDDIKILQIWKIGEKIDCNTIYKFNIPKECWGRRMIIYFGNNKLLETSISSELQKLCFRIAVDEKDQRFELLVSHNNVCYIVNSCPINIDRR